MVYPSVVLGHRGVGVAIVRCFFVLRWFKNPLRPRRSGEAYGTRSIIAEWLAFGPFQGRKNRTFKFSFLY